MNSQAWPWPLVDCLIQCFNLNECEAADLSDQAQRLLDAGVSRDDLAKRLRVWADILIKQGSSMQAMWNILARGHP